MWNVLIIRYLSHAKSGLIFICVWSDYFWNTREIPWFTKWDLIDRFLGMLMNVTGLLVGHQEPAFKYIQPYISKYLYMILITGFMNVIWIRILSIHYLIIRHKYITVLVTMKINVLYWFCIRYKCVRCQCMLSFKAFSCYRTGVSCR